jgi:CheY-like chemotaxis protein
MTKKILIVDDEDYIRSLLIEVLSDAGYEVLAAAEGKEALGILEQHQVDLIITDIIMPDMEGIEFINKVKRQKKLSAKIIAISGSGNVRVDSYLNLALKMGADSVLEKPFTIDQVLEAVRTSL